jgi:hypothetical protein
MRVRLSAVLAATTVAAGVAIASALPARANAATPTSVRTYHEALDFNLVGTGTHAGWYYHYNGVELVVLSPRLEYYTAFRQEAFGNNGKLTKTNEVQYIVGGWLYTGVNGGRWRVQKQSPRQLQADVYQFNTAVGLAKFEAIPGVTLVGPHHYQVTASRAQANAFLTYEYNLTSNDLASGSITAVTIGAWTDSRGHVTRFVITAKSAEEQVSVVETFTGYNRPLTITAPHAS